MDTKNLQRIICAGLLGSALVLNGVASAAVVTNRVPLLGYAEHNITVYRAPGGMKAAVVAAESALIQITQVRADGWAYGTYPMSNGRRAGGWFRMIDVQSNVNYNNANGKIVMQQTVYRTPSMSGSNGVVVVGENVLVIAEQDGFSQIIYKQKNSANWRIGWVLSSAIQKELVAVPMNRSQNSASLQKTTPITSNVKVSSKQTANDSVQKVQTSSTAQKTTTQTTAANTSANVTVQKTIQQQPKPTTTTNDSAKNTTTQSQSGLMLSGNSSVNLQLGSSSGAVITNGVINRYGIVLRQAPAFPNANLTNRQNGEYAGANDIVVILEASGNAYKITYPAKDRLKDRWVSKSNIGFYDRVNYQSWKGKIKWRVDAHHALTLNLHPVNPEYAEKGDMVTVLDEAPNAYFISYELVGGSYKARWVDKNAVEKVNMDNRVIVPTPVINNNTNPIVNRVGRVTNGIKGDMDQNGKVDNTDLDILMKVIVEEVPATNSFREAGDMNEDGELDVMDLANLTNAITKGAKFKPEIAKRHVDVYNEEGKILNGRYIDRGESYTVIEERGNRLKVNYKSAKGEDRQGWVSNLIREDVPVSNVKEKLIYSVFHTLAGTRLLCDFDGYSTAGISGRHEGIDISLKNGAEVYAVIDGEITCDGGDKFNTFSIYDANNNKTVVYLHFSKVAPGLKAGNRITKGALVGYQGASGTKTSHVHIEVRNGKRQKAAISIGDKTLDNDNPYPYWQKVL